MGIRGLLPQSGLDRYKTRMYTTVYGTSGLAPVIFKFEIHTWIGFMVLQLGPREVPMRSGLDQSAQIK